MQEADDSSALVAKAIGFHQAGRLDEAQALYDKALAMRPSQVDALHLSGVLLHQRNGSVEALRRLRAALALSPRAAAIHFNCGKVLREMGRLAESISSLRRAAELDPRFDAAHFELAAALDESSRFEEALDAFFHALSVRPSAASWYGVGNCLARMQRLEEAVSAYQTALRFEPNYREAAYNLALVLVSLGRCEEASPIAARFSADSRNALALFNAGQISLSIGRLATARDLFIQALSLEADLAPAKLGLSQLDLLQGHFESGWRAYEARWTMPDQRSNARYADRPFWTGTEELRAKTVLVHAEQGLGDTLQFCRYLPLLAGRGAKVVAQVQKPAVALLRRSLGEAVRVISDDEAPPPFDLQCPMLSLPMAFGTRLETIDGNVPYLTPGPRPAWLEEACSEDGVLIGLAWSGNNRHANDINRSIPPRHLRTLLDAFRGSGGRPVQFIALQTYFRPSDREVLAEHPSLLRFTPKIGSFDDTAALAGACDLIVSVDTSVAHLAGALARPLWLLLPYVPDWRWLLDRVSSPWYPQARLIRQEQPGDWDGVLKRVAKDLRFRIGSKGLA
jgi:tetratricopeptide (TPR) repeat protein